MKEQETYIAQAVRATENNRRIDIACKMVLKSKWILASILSDIFPEYQGYTPKEIVENYIEPDEIYSDIPVSALMAATAETVNGEDKENDVPGETKVFYDVKFRTLLPNKQKAQIYLYIDVEAQNAYYPGYSLIKRAEYYLSRLLSAQLQTVSNDTNYDVLQKVYSIWICMGRDIPKKYKQTITKYEFKEEDIFGNVETPKEHYDLMTAIIIRLGETETTEKTIGMLQELFMERTSAEERLNRLEQLYGIPKTKEFSEEVANVCSYSQYVKEEGKIEGDMNRQRKTALKMLRANRPREEILEFTELTEEELSALEEQACTMA